MEKHHRKMIAPLVITFIIVLYYAVFAGLVLWMPECPVWMKWLFGLVPLALIGVMIYVCVERMKEIRSGEEDDLSKY